MHLITKLSLLLAVTEISLHGNVCKISCKDAKGQCKCKAVNVLCESDHDTLCFQKNNSTCCCFDKVECSQDTCNLDITCTGREMCKVECVAHQEIHTDTSCAACADMTPNCRWINPPIWECTIDFSDCSLECSCAKSSCETTTDNIFTSDGETSDTSSTVSTTENNIQNTSGTTAMTQITSERNTGTVATAANTNISSTREPDVSGSQKGDSVPAAIVVGVLVAIVAFAAVVVGVLCWYKRSRAFHKREGLEDTEHKPTLGINDDEPGSPINPYDVPDAKTMGSNTKNEHVYCTLTDERDNNTPVLDPVSPNGVYSLATNISNAGTDRNLPNAPGPGVIYSLATNISNAGTDRNLPNAPDPQVVYSLATNIPNSGADRNLPNARDPEVVYSLATNIPNSGADRNLPNAPVQEQEYSLAKNVHTKEKCAAESDTNSHEVNSQYFILESEHDRNDQYTSTEVPNNDQYFILEEQSETGGVLSEMKAIQSDVNIPDTEYCALEPMDTSKHDADYTQLKQNSPKEEIIPDYFELEPDSSL